MKSRVSVESVILVAICLVDMLVTLFLVLWGCAVEQNPLMAACINHSPATFVFVKVASFVPFIVAVEIYRRKNPHFALTACRCAIILYVMTFAVLTFGTNIT